MSSPASAAAPEPELSSLDSQVDHAIALCDGDMRAALAAALVYNTFLERKLEMMRGMISSGYTRGKVSPARQASGIVDTWREILSGSESK